LKLPAPTISYANDVIVLSNTYAKTELLATNQFNVSLKVDPFNLNILPGLYRFEAQNLAQKSTDRILNSNKSNFLELEKLAAPSLAVVNGELTATNMLEGFSVYINGSKYGPLSKNLPPGILDLSARNEAFENDQISSAFTSTLSVTKLKTPGLSLSNNALVVANAITNSTRYYSGLIHFDGNLFNLSAGPHTITARNIALSNSELNSDLSAYLEVVKLATPSVSFANNQLTILNRTPKVNHYVNDSLFDGDLSKVPVGNVKIKVQNARVNSWEIDSNFSNELTLTKPIVFFLPTNIAGNKVKIEWRDQSEIIIDWIVRWFFNDETLIKSEEHSDVSTFNKIWFSEDCIKEFSYEHLRFLQPTQVADYIEITVTIKDKTSAKNKYITNVYVLNIQRN
jgi:hypothetical protein